MNAEISETMGRLLRFGVQIPELLTQRRFVSGFGMQIPELLTQRKFVLAAAQTAQNCDSYIDATVKIVTEMICSH